MSEIRRAVVKSYDAATHKADVQIAGSLTVWLDAVRVATNIPAADVVTGRQCTVLFLDPSNQDTAVIISIQGAAPSTGSVLVATATSALTLTSTAQSIVGDGDSSKVRILLPTPGDWLIEATCDFHITTSAVNFSAIGELFVNDSGSAETGALIKEMQAKDRATVAQRWKVTTTAADTPVELKARKDTSSGVARAEASQTRLTAIGPNRTADPIPTPSATVVDETTFGQVAAAGSATPYSRGDHTHGTPTDPVPTHVALANPHTVYGALAQAETWAALQTFNAGISLAAGQTIQAAGTPRYEPANSSPHNKLTGDVYVTGGITLDGLSPAGSLLRLFRNQTLPAGFAPLTIIAGVHTIANDGNQIPLLDVVAQIANTGHINTQLWGLRFRPALNAGTFSEADSIKTDPQIIGSALVTTMRQFHAGKAGSFLFTPAAGSGTHVGLDVDDLGHANFATTIGVRIANQTASPTARLIEALGLTNTNLRVNAADPPDAALATEGDSAIYLAWMENGAVNLRQLRWRQQNQLGATDKVLIAA